MELQSSDEFRFLPVRQAGEPLEVLCSECGTECDECSFDQPNLVPTCAEVMAHSESAGGNTTVATVLIHPGYWRATTFSLLIDVSACYHADACLGGVTGRAGYCREGYEGPCE